MTTKPFPQWLMIALTLLSLGFGAGSTINSIAKNADLQDTKNRVSVVESQLKDIKDNLDYIRDRVDQINNRIK